MKPIGKTALSLLFLSLLVLPVRKIAFPTDLSPTVQSEIAHLFSYLEKSGCQYYRNGTWYKEAKAVKDHVDKKYRYFAGKGKIDSTEDFIKWAATKSELSGKPYMVKCENGPEMPLAQWLTDELGRYRKQAPSNRGGAGAATSDK
jgi:hypothetical protein